ncbi:MULTISPECIES: DUF4430 domain-containing protein [Gordonibacter]|uniref:DUF4430 domain-containing protein n=1 Tax=Gordonibacter faecis TaxID=3047475 RepID=A0ABT7DQP7_9ACTN|nr:MULTISPECIES: DUF4430 domain-containing protein [unclassified Gordonibacter]MDJ1651863.1 DUF4430 domain-containing protein [Gordonibacter sp. KGMB12511]HIW75291.1 DUF4430 domain-containing protein [Candidatus Gordonibacter avicola]
MERDERKQEASQADEALRQATTAAASDPAPAVTSDKAPQPKRPASRVLIAAVAALSVVLIGASSLFLFAPADQSNAGSAPPTPSQSAPDTADHKARTEVPAASQDEASSDGGADKNAGSSTGAADSATDGAPSSASDAAQNHASNPSTPSTTPPPAPDPAPAPPQAATVTVTVSVESSAAGGPVSGGTTVTFNQGATVYDALMACGLSVNASNSAFGVYVNAIGGLAEKEHGSASGWVYTVNGADPGVSCSSCVLNDGDDVRWFYVV